jgi:hypothetical protein
MERNRHPGSLGGAELVSDLDHQVEELVDMSLRGSCVDVTGTNRIMVVDHRGTDDVATTPPDFDQDSLIEVVEVFY